MRAPPPGLSTETIAAAVERNWGIRVRSLVHQPLGFGSYHWLADGDQDGVRWWVTVDDLDARRASVEHSLDDAFDALARAMATSRGLGDAGWAFVVAPRPAVDGSPVVRLGERHAIVVHPYVDGRTHEWGEILGPHERASIVDVLAALHRVPRAAVPQAGIDAGGFDHRDAIERSLDRGSDGAGDRAIGPFATQTSQLVAAHRAELARALARGDRLLEGADCHDRLVLTHGEPHPGNLIEVDGGWRLIDWDTTRIAPPERDVWMLVRSDAYPDAEPGPPRTLPGDRIAVIDRYEAATGSTLDRDLLEGYRLRWDLADVGSYLHQLRAPHTGGPDDEQAWINLNLALGRIDRAASLGG